MIWGENPLFSETSIFEKPFAGDGWGEMALEKCQGAGEAPTGKTSGCAPFFKTATIGTWDGFVVVG